MRKVLVYLNTILVGVVFVAVRFANPDMTETRLFLEFWWVYLIGIAALALCYFIIRGEET